MVAKTRDKVQFTPFSNFVRNATDAEKRKFYDKVIQLAILSDSAIALLFFTTGCGLPSKRDDNGKFDGGQSTASECSLRDFYQRLLTFTSQSQALTDEYAETHTATSKSSIL